MLAPFIEAALPATRKNGLKAIRLQIRKANGREVSKFPSVARLLTQGGDSRIVCGPLGRNRYGCSAQPEPDVLAYGSSTAATISPAGYVAAERLRMRLSRAAVAEIPAVTYERELDRVRSELTRLCELENLVGLEIILGASGTDLHLFAGQLVAGASELPPLIVRVEPAETGTGVPDALAGRHFSDCAALGDIVLPKAPLDWGRPAEIVEIKCRTADGACRPSAEVDAEVEAAVAAAAVAGRRVLLTLVDVSKTGMITPSPACVHSLRCRFPQLIEVLVDACQFRLAASTLRAYLEHHFLVAVTGSKFLPGPTFCGAILVPAEAAKRLRTQTLPRALKSYSGKAEWPRKWVARAALDHVANYGLLLRWEAALTELRVFRPLPDSDIAEFLETFANAVTERVASCPAFELVPASALNRGPIAPANSWDRFPTLFSFLLLRRSGAGKRIWLKQSETQKVHELLREDLRDDAGAASHSFLSTRCQVGQPVACGTRDGVPVSALRLCVSSRLVVDAVSPGGRGSRAVIADAMTVLDKAAFLTSLPLT